MSIRRIIIALFIGIAVTITLSWLAMFLPSGNAWYGPPTTTDLGLWREQDDHKIWQMSRGDDPWHSVVTYWHMQLSGMSLMIPTEDYQARAFEYHKLPRHFRPESLDDLNMNAWFHATGWPFKSMTVRVQWNRQVRNSDIIYDVFGGFQLPRDAQFNPRALPLTPIWPAFIADVLIYACLWLLLIQTLRVLRAQLRVKKNRCCNCGYPRTGLPVDGTCPECGHTPPSATPHKSDND